MATTSEHHHKLKDGVGKCSVPMWAGGCPAGFCDEPAYGERPPGETYYNYASEQNRRIDGRYAGYVPGLACPAHGGPPKPAETSVSSTSCAQATTAGEAPAPVSGPAPALKKKMTDERLAALAPKIYRALLEVFDQPLATEFDELEAELRRARSEEEHTLSVLDEVRAELGAAQVLIERHERAANLATEVGKEVTAEHDSLRAQVDQLTQELDGRRAELAEARREIATAVQECESAIAARNAAREDAEDAEAAEAQMRLERDALLDEKKRAEGIVGVCVVRVETQAEGETRHVSTIPKMEPYPQDALDSVGRDVARALFESWGNPPSKQLTERQLAKWISDIAGNLAAPQADMVNRILDDIEAEHSGRAKS